MPTISIYRNGSTIITTITGLPGDVQAEVDSIFRVYPTGGYNTQIEQDDRTESGLRIVQVSRWDNCD